MSRLMCILDVSSAMTQLANGASRTQTTLSQSVPALDQNPCSRHPSPAVLVILDFLFHHCSWPTVPLITALALHHGVNSRSTRPLKPISSVGFLYLSDRTLRISSSHHSHYGTLAVSASAPCATASLFVTGRLPRIDIDGSGDLHRAFSGSSSCCY